MVAARQARLGLAGFAFTQALAWQPAAAAPQPAAPAPVPAEPQQTTASFGDWTVRCVSGIGGSRMCEAAQSLILQANGRQVPFAEIAFGTANGRSIITVLLPVDIAFAKPARLGPDDDHMLSLSFTRCIPAGCFANGEPGLAVRSAWRAATKAGRLIFVNASGRTIGLPVSLRGLAQALDALAREP